MDPGTDAMPSLLMQIILKKDKRHAASTVVRAVVGGLARAHAVHGIKVLDRQATIVRLIMRGSKLVQIDARTIHATGPDPSGLGMMQPKGRPQ